jgi:hypothetical protein
MGRQVLRKKQIERQSDFDFFEVKARTAGLKQGIVPGAGDSRDLPGQPGE